MWFYLNISVDMQEYDCYVACTEIGESRKSKDVICIGPGKAAFSEGLKSWNILYFSCFLSTRFAAFQWKFSSFLVLNSHWLDQKFNGSVNHAP